MQEKEASSYRGAVDGECCGMAGMRLHKQMSTVTDCGHVLTQRITGYDVHISLHQQRHVHYLRYTTLIYVQWLISL